MCVALKRKTIYAEIFKYDTISDSFKDQLWSILKKFIWKKNYESLILKILRSKDAIKAEFCHF